MRRTYWITALILAGHVAVSANAQTVLALQETVEPAPQVIVGQLNDGRVRIAFGGDAFEVLQEFREVMSQYPPTLRDMLRLDPALMLDADFLAPYPALAEYLATHPEVVHNPTYFLGPGGGGGDVSEAVAITLVFLIVAGSIIWLVKTGVEYRRWSRASRVHAEVQAKLLDRFSGSDDLLAYLETPAGRRLLESAPVSPESGGSTPIAPTGRILWSLQAGLVLALGGSGFHFAIPRMAEPDAADQLYVIGTLAIALGIGFILSAGAALLLSRRLGLIQPAETSKQETPRGPA